MNVDLQKFCEMVDNAGDDLDLLKELSDFLKANQQRFEQYQVRFMYEHMTDAMKKALDKKKIKSIYSY